MTPRPPESQGFTPVRNRWGVERTKAWNGRFRRNRKAYERTPASAAAMLHIRQLHLLLRNPAPSTQHEVHYNAVAEKFPESLLVQPRE